MRRDFLSIEQMRLVTLELATGARQDSEGLGSRRARSLFELAAGVQASLDERTYLLSQGHRCGWAEQRM